jgi:hypothetical protein
MPSSRVRQNASCTWIPFVQTVSSPSYTLSSCRRPRDGVPVPGVLCSSFTSTPPSAVGLGTVFSFSTVLPCALHLASNTSESDVGAIALLTLSLSTAI